jgi:hypothetical protein
VKEFGQGRLQLVIHRSSTSTNRSRRIQRRGERPWSPTNPGGRDGRAAPETYRGPGRTRTRPATLEALADARAGGARIHLAGERSMNRAAEGRLDPRAGRDATPGRWPLRSVGPANLAPAPSGYAASGPAHGTDYRTGVIRSVSEKLAKWPRVFPTPAHD